VRTREADGKSACWSFLGEEPSPPGSMFEPVTVEITRATPDRVHELAALIGHAFSDDPIALWSLAPEATEEQVRLWFLWFDEVVAPLGMLWEAGRGLGAAVWFPPGEDERFIETDRTVRRVVASFSDDGGARYAAFWDWVGEHLPDEPHWFLTTSPWTPNSEARGSAGP